MRRATVSHFELPAEDPERAAAFYREVFGWRVEALEWEGGVYFTVRTQEPTSPSPSDRRGAIQGGLGRPETVGAERPLLVVHLTGEDIEACLERIEAAGGRRDGAPRAVGSFGRTATFLDPEGNRLGLWTSAG